MHEREQIKELLELKYKQYASKEFIENDPVCIPHRFSLKEDIEIAGFISATLAWGNRKAIINSASKWLNLMDNSPYDFVMNCSKNDLKKFEKFVHRTFNGHDCMFFMNSLKRIYISKGGLENCFTVRKNNSGNRCYEAIVTFRKEFLRSNHLKRSEKHISNPEAGSSAKRLCMFLRWMVRKDKNGVDFGIWNCLNPSDLCLPLDVHTGKVARAIGLLKRKQNDWKSVEELTDVLKTFDTNDPVKYDFALFGMGLNKEIN